MCVCFFLSFFLCAAQDDAKEIQKAVEMLKSVEWKQIRAEKFPLTPIALFESFTSTVESLISRHAAEIIRRREWLANAEEEVENEDQSQNVSIVASNADKYGVAPLQDGFFLVTLSMLRCPCLNNYMGQTKNTVIKVSQLPTTKKNMNARWT